MERRRRKRHDRRLGLRRLLPHRDDAPSSRHETTAATYGIFSSNWSGGTWDQTYASNFNDSGFYIGACQQQCNQTINDVWSEYNALGYSGSNSGGPLMIKNSQFDHNKDGFDTNSQNGDNPPPQDGACPNGGSRPITHTQSCWVFMHNYVHDNNNPNVPLAGLAGGGRSAPGCRSPAARNDTVMNNRFVNNNAWGTIIVPFRTAGRPAPAGRANPGGRPAAYTTRRATRSSTTPSPTTALYGNPSNGDFAQPTRAGHPTNCFARQSVNNGGTLKTDAATLKQTYPNCSGRQPVARDLTNPQFLREEVCDSEV